MKRLFLFMALMLALIGVSSVSLAQDVNPASMAKYFPAETQVFAALRTDEAYLDTLDGVIKGLIGKLPPELGVPQIGVRNLIQQALGPITLDDVRGWLGDYAALGVPDLTAGMGGNQAPVYVAVAITDKAAAEAFFMQMAPGMEERSTRSEDGGFIIYRANPDVAGGGVLAFGDDVLIVGANTTDLPAGGLDSSEKFNATLAKLPAASYNIVIYAEFQPALTAAAGQLPPQAAASFEVFGVDLENLNPAAVGFTVLDGNSLTIDLVQPGVPGMMPQMKAVNPAFAANIPDSFSFVVHGSDLATTINTSLDLAVTASETSDNPTTRPQLAGLVQMFTGLDLDEDLLPWMGSDFALFFDSDMLPVLETASTGQTPETIPLNFGLAFDVTGNPEAAQKTVTTLGETLARMSGQNAEVTVTTGEVGGVEAVILENVPVSRSNPVIETDIVLGTNGSVLLLADRETAETIFSGDFTGLDNSTAFAEAAGYVLPGSSVVLYADGAGYGDLIALAGALLMPSRSGDDPAQLANLLRFGYDLFSSSSVSMTMLEDGDTLVRAVLTLQ